MLSPMEGFFSIESLEALLRSHGYGLLFAVGFLEFAGLPVASAPALVLAGSFVAAGAMELPSAIAAAVLGGLTADLIWYRLARSHGAPVLRLACGLATHPGGCAASLRRKIEKAGGRSVLTAKLLPGLANLAAASAGLARLPLHRFLPANVAGLVFWASVDLGLGWLFAERVQEALGWLSTYSWIVLSLAGLAIAGALVWRAVKIRIHRRMHAAREPPA